MTIMKIIIERGRSWTLTHLVALNFCFRRLHDVPYLTISHAHTVSVSDLSCLKPTERPTFVTEIVAQGIPKYRFEFDYKYIHPMQIFYMISQLYQG